MSENNSLNKAHIKYIEHELYIQATDVNRYIVKNDSTLHFIVFAYYVNKRTVNFIAAKMREKCGAVVMQPCAGKSNVRVPSLKTMKRNIEKELDLAKSIIHELLVTGFVLLRTGKEKAKNIKITY